MEKNGIGYHEKHRRYYAKATKLYFKKGLGYRRISKLIPVAATTIKRWWIIFAEENGIPMEKKQVQSKNQRIKHLDQQLFRKTSKRCDQKSQDFKRS